MYIGVFARDAYRFCLRARARIWELVVEMEVGGVYAKTFRYYWFVSPSRFFDILSSTNEEEKHWKWIVDLSVRPGDKRNMDKSKYVFEIDVQRMFV